MSYYKIADLEQYFKHYKKSVREPRKFWGKIAEENFVWYQGWDKVCEFDMSQGEVKWFIDGKLNITKNCIDRHLAKRGDRTAIIFEPNNPNEKEQIISYSELYERVAKTANVLKSLGVKKGDRVCIYLPMIPELVQYIRLFLPDFPMPQFVHALKIVVRRSSLHQMVGFVVRKSLKLKK